MFLLQTEDLDSALLMFHHLLLIFTALWTILAEQGLKPKALVACLYFLMQQVDQYVSSADDREVAILAAHLYFTMIGVPGESYDTNFVLKFLSWYLTDKKLYEEVLSSSTPLWLLLKLRQMLVKV